MCKNCNIKFSIVVPVYNVKNYLERCLDSLINQTFKNIEIVLVDDGSNDGSDLICDEYASKFEYIKVVHKLNGGLSDARNVGIDNASGEYIIFVDSDDYLCCDSCEKFNLLTNDKPEVITGNAYVLRENGKIEYMKPIGSSKSVFSGLDYMVYQMSHGTCFMAAWLYVYRTDYLKKYNLRFKKGILHEDEEFTPRALINATTVSVSDIIHYNYIIREGSITTSKNKTKNALDVRDTLFSLEKIYRLVDDEDKLKILCNNLVNTFLSMWVSCNVGKNQMKKELKFLYRNCYNIKTYFKLLIFTLNTTLYKNISNMLHK